MGWQDAPIVGQRNVAPRSPDVPEMPLPGVESIPKDSWESAPVVSQNNPSRTGFMEFDRQFGGSMADTLGSPADAINYLTQTLANVVSPGTESLKIPAGGDDIRTFLNDMGVNIALPDQQPENLVGRAGQGAGIAASFALPFMGTASQMNRAQQIEGAMTQAPRMVTGSPSTTMLPRRIADDMAETMMRNPKTAMAAETALGGTSGAGGYLAEQAYPESPDARMAGELAGGGLPIIASQMVKFLLSKMPGVQLGKKVVDDFSERFMPKGAEGRAGARVQRATDDPLAADKMIQNKDATLEGLTPAQQSGDAGLMELEKSVMESSDELYRQGERQLADVNKNIKSTLQEFGGSKETESTRQAFEARQSDFIDQMEKRVAAAEKEAERKLNQAGPGRNQEQVNRDAADEIERVLTNERKKEEYLYTRVPEKSAVPYSESEKTYKKLSDALGEAQKSDVPQLAKKFLDPSSKSYFGAAGSQQTTIKELRALQSKLRESARIARSNNQHNKARIADDIANAITDDIANTAAGPGVAQSVKNAVDFSRRLNEKFSRGTVGKLLGKTKEGGETVSSSLTLEASIGSRGPKARQAYDDILKAVNTPAMKGAVEDYLKNRFAKETNKKNFMKNNADILDRVPKLKKQFEQAIESGDVAALKKRQADSLGARMSNPRISKASLFIQKDIEKAFDDVYKSRTPEQDMQKLLNMARKDTTGEAEKGLKAGFMANLLSKSKIGTTDIDDEAFVSGKKLKDFLDSDAGAAIVNKLFTKEEKGRLDQVANTAVRLDMSRKSKPSKEGVIGDEPNMLYSIMGRIGGAQLGRWIAGKTGGGTVQTPGILSNQIQKLIKAGVTDPASSLIIEAVQDEQLFRALLMRSADIKGPKKKFIKQRINAWATGLLNDIGGDPDELSEEAPDDMDDD